MSETPRAVHTADDPLCRGLLDALHGTAQPLTILRSSLGSASRLRRMSELQLRELVDSSAIEVERLCRYFSYIEQLVVVESKSPSCDMEDLPRLVVHTLDGGDVLFAEAGIKLAFANYDELHVPVLADSSRFQRALSEILLILLQIAVRDDSLTLTLSPGAASLDIVLERVSAEPLSVKSEARLRMGLAEANLRTQGMTLIWQTDPFHATIQWQRADTQTSL